MKSQTTNHAKRGLSARSEHPPNLRGVNVWGMDFTWTPAYFGLRLSKNGQGLNDWYAILLEWGPHGAPKIRSDHHFFPNAQQGFPFHSGGLGVEGVFARRCATVRNRSQPFATVTLHSTLYTPHSTLHTLHSTLYTPYSTFHTLHSTLHTLHSTLYTRHFTLNTLHLTLHTLHFTLHTLHSTLHTLQSTLYTPHSTLYTPHSPHSTL